MDELPPESVVIRGGENQAPPALSGAFWNHHDRGHNGYVKGKPHYCFAISVNCIPGLAEVVLAMRAQRPNGTLSVATVGDLTDAGFSIDPTPGRQETDGHCDVYLPGASARLPEVEELLMLERVFAKKIENPWGRPQ